MEDGGHDLSSALWWGRSSTRKEVFSATWYRDTHRAAVYRGDSMCQYDGAPSAMAPHRGQPEFPTGCFDPTIDPEYAEPYDDAEQIAEVSRWLTAQERAQRDLGDAVKTAAPDADEGEMLRRLGYAE